MHIVQQWLIVHTHALQKLVIVMSFFEKFVFLTALCLLDKLCIGQCIGVYIKPALNMAL